jgi:hypothetical protein
MKRNIFWLGMLVMILTFGMTVVSCDDGGDDNNNGSVFTPTQIHVQSDGVAIMEFECDRANSTLPGIDADGYINSSCGFSITVRGSNMPVKSLRVITGVWVQPQNTLTSNEVTLSYTPNGTHIFKHTSGKTLGAFTINN